MKTERDELELDLAFVKALLAGDVISLVERRQIRQFDRVCLEHFVAYWEALLVAASEDKAA